ncbi:MAG: hypothetical protein D6737_04445 [Chloroflexi bacterium]|nr:MAG: hypothetical protein D6737_04445 [Chloroflexota bacterium]
MDAQNLYREGVLALREKKDSDTARKLLTQSLRLNPNNEMGWLWLARTIKDPQKRMQCVERALKLNPHNKHALDMKARFAAALNGASATVLTTDAAQAPPRPNAISKPSPAAQLQIKKLLDKAEACLANQDVEGAIEQWVTVLDIQVDHEKALASASRHLAKLGYMDDVKELLHRAIESGTTVPSIYLTAIDLAQRESQYAEADNLRDQLATLPTATDEIICDIADHYMQNGRELRALAILEDAIKVHKDNPALLLRIGDIHKEMFQEEEARQYYDRAARAGKNSKAGQEADKRLLDFAPIETDQERGSIILAVREAVGFGIFYLALGWQDAGLNLLQMGLLRWVGVLLSMIGGYFIVTAVSSPQQKPIARWFGGEVPEPAKRKKAKPLSAAVSHDLIANPFNEDDDEDMMEVAETKLPILPLEVRYAMGIIGLLILIIAFRLVFETSIDLLFDPAPPLNIPTIDELIAE